MLLRTKNIVMKKIKIVSGVLLIFLLTQCGTAQNLNRFTKLVNDNAPIGVHTDSIFRSIQLRSDLLLGYVLAGKSWDYLLISFQNKQPAKAYHLVLETSRNYNNRYKVDSFELAKTISDSILAVFNRNEGWTLKYNQETDMDPCKHVSGKKGCSIFDGASEELWVASKTNKQTSIFYEAGYFEQCCPGNPSRQRFLAMKNAILNFFNQAGVDTRKYASTEYHRRPQ